MRAQGQRGIPDAHQHILRRVQGRNPEFSLMLEILEQAFLFLELLFPAPDNILGALHHGGAARAHVPFVQDRGFRGRNMALALFGFPAPVLRAARAFRQARDIPPEHFAPGLLGLVLDAHAVFPGVVVALHDPHVTAVQAHDVVDAGVEKRAVMADQQESALLSEVRGGLLAALPVQMVGGLINERVRLLPDKEQRKQKPGLFAGGQGGEHLVQEAGVQAHEPRFLFQTPDGRARA